MSDVKLAVDDIEFDNPTPPVPVDLLTDDLVTDDMLHQLKKNKMRKPPGVSWSKWLGIGSEYNPVHEHVINLAALGMTNRKIAQQLGITDTLVSLVVNAPEIKDLISAKISDLYEEPKSQLKALFPKAFATFNKILDDVNERSALKADVAKFIIEHTIGKAHQTHTVEGNLLSELIVKVEKQAIRDVNATAANLLDKPKDEFDDLVTEIIPADVVIGKRGVVDAQD